MVRKSLQITSDLVHLPKQDGSTNEVGLDIHPIPSSNSLLVTVTPPKAPTKSMKHVPCDIVLVIDVSGSMNSDAPAPVANPSEQERNGLTVLDLTKHAARTILETLDENDRLGLVTFSTEAKVVQQLLPMTKKNKTATLTKINSLKVESMTNLWHGILEGIKLFEDDERDNSVASIMILTDGLPNHMCPPQGYIPKLRNYKLPGSINTFGFGYSIRSGLLKSIAEIGNGNYAFIPDAGMIGTVFIHAIANLQSTYATTATLKIKSPSRLEIAEAVGDYVGKQTSTSDGSYSDIHHTLNISIGNLQYGQSRDIFLTYKDATETSTIEAYLDYSPLDSPRNSMHISSKLLNEGSLHMEMEIYHEYRSHICNFLSSLAPLNNKNGEHEPMGVAQLPPKREELRALIDKFKRLNPRDELNISLGEDLYGTEPCGQISLAISTDAFYGRWGKHYLLSLHNAYAKQICNSFKDSGPLQFGKDSPLFISCRDRLDQAFDSLPPPKPSAVVKDEHGTVVKRRVNMSSYHNRSNPCFAGSCGVKLESGKTIPVADVRPGISVWTPAGSRKVVEVVATNVEGEDMCIIGNTLIVTNWHPIRFNSQWVFPAQIALKKTRYFGSIYSLLLGKDNCVDAHSLEVGGFLAVTLGHGMTDMESGDVRSHTFLGDYDKVLGSIRKLPQLRDGIRESMGMDRRIRTGLVCEFLGGLIEDDGLNTSDMGLFPVRQLLCMKA
ncbi:U-box domain-containing protein [Tothia fuscella]|uniref:U-box domain-containing protein n=1 Tax=Tothia fuscella TaxID=1048955 RepID=A0A9P4TSE5_9PEZI|nr:U-box domain-containing protein [Tothia fuscella]